MLKHRNPQGKGVVESWYQLGFEHPALWELQGHLCVAWGAVIYLLSLRFSILALMK